MHLRPNFPFRSTIYVQLSTLRDTLDITVISPSVNKIIIMQCTIVLLRFVNAAPKGMNDGTKGPLYCILHILAGEDC